MDRLGIGFDQVAAVNPAVIYCSISGMGQHGPLAAIPGHDLNYQAWAGVLSPDGGPPVIPEIPIADLAAGMAGLRHLCRLGAPATDREGERIDVAMSDILATWTGAAAPRSAVGDSGRRASGVRTFATADDGYIALGVVTEDHFWRPLCDALGPALREPGLCRAHRPVR